MIRVGIIGCGSNGFGHFKNLRKIEGVQVTAIYDVVKEQAESWIKDLEPEETPPAIVTNLEDMWQHVDAVWVTTPPGYHYEHSIAALREGKHVMCEKPIALEIPHADDMLRVAKEKNVKLFVGYCLRFQPVFAHFAEIVTSGKIGDLLSLWCDRVSSDMSTSKWKGSWRDDIAICGGMMIETFTHNIDWMRLVAGEVKSVHMKEHTVKPYINFEDHAVGLIEFENGASATFYSSWAAGESRYEWGVIGTKGTAKASGGDREHIFVSYTNGEKETIKLEPTRHSFLEDEQFIRAIKYDEPLLFTAEDSARTLETHVALKLSAKVGKPVSVPIADRTLGIPSFALDKD